MRLLNLIFGKSSIIKIANFSVSLILLIYYFVVHEVPKWSDLNSKVVPHHTVRWRYIGIELGLVSSVLDTIAENCAVKPQRSQECFNAVLEKWLMQDGPKATWNKLEHAITNVQRAELGLSPLEMSMFTNSA